MNTVIITKCNLTKDPELKYTSSQKAVCNFSIADNHGYGENKQTSFFNVVAWNKLAEMVCQYLKKGSGVNIYGRLQQRSYENKEGQVRQVVEVIANNIEFLEKKSGAPTGEPVRDVNEPPANNEDPALDFPDFG